MECEQRLEEKERELQQQITNAEIMGQDNARIRFDRNLEEKVIEIQQLKIENNSLKDEISRSLATRKHVDNAEAALRRTQQDLSEEVYRSTQLAKVV